MWLQRRRELSGKQAKGWRGGRNLSVVLSDGSNPRRPQRAPEGSVFAALACEHSSKEWEPCTPRKRETSVSGSENARRCVLVPRHGP